MFGKLMLLGVVALLLFGSANAANAFQTKAFQNGNIVNFAYFDNFTCFPSPAVTYLNSSESVAASSVTACEFGSAIGVNTTDSIPRWDLIPAFAGLSVYGYAAYGSTPQGYPTYDGQIVPTECGAGGTSNACLHRPSYFYSTIISAIENRIGISAGINGLPEGVLPNAARDILVSSKHNSTISSSYSVRVWVFDPNIFPNSTTGKCRQVAPSNLTDPIAHCLTSVDALLAAINTNDSAIAVINANNILWKTARRPTTQVAILNAVLLLSNSTNPQFAVQQSTDINMSNTNLFAYTYVGNVSQHTSTTTIAQGQQYPGASTPILAVAALLIIAILVGWYMARGRLWGVKSRPRMKQRKAQGAMEFLMTYGWAILIIAVVLGALYSVGVFNFSTSLGSGGCSAVSGYYCGNPHLAQNDNITLTIGTLTNTRTIYNVAVACSSTVTGPGLPSPSPASGTPQAAMIYIYANGVATSNIAIPGGTSLPSTSLSLALGQKTTITGLTCYGTNVGPSITPTMGTAFNGYLWLDYTTSSGQPTAAGGTNPFYTVKFATVSVKVGS